VGDDSRMVIETLRAFFEKQTTAPRLVRALVAHDGWYVPMLWAMTVLRRTSFDDVVGERRGSIAFEALRAFTSRDAVIEAREEGCYVGPIRGSELFDKLPIMLTTIDVNPGLAAASRWSIEGAGIDVMREIGRARALERAIDTWAPDVRQRLVNHEFWMYRSATNAIALYSRELPFGLVFTDRYAADVVAEALVEWKLLRVRGSTLFAAVHALRLHGFLVNPFADVNRVVPREMCDELAAMAG
jgi:hypothetical protein